MSDSSILCKTGCGACCIAPSITSPIPGMPDGKPAGIACIQLDDHWNCKLFGQPDRPAFCNSLQPSIEMCGTEEETREYAVQWLTLLEEATTPVSDQSEVAAIRPVQHEYSP